jgi:hypothetical protein
MKGEEVSPSRRGASVWRRGGRVGVGQEGPSAVGCGQEPGCGCVRFDFDHARPLGQGEAHGRRQREGRRGGLARAATAVVPGGEVRLGDAPYGMKVRARARGGQGAGLGGGHAGGRDEGLHGGLGQGAGGELVETLGGRGTGRQAEEFHGAVPLDAARGGDALHVALQPLGGPRQRRTRDPGRETALPAGAGGDSLALHRFDGSAEAHRADHRRRRRRLLGDRERVARRIREVPGFADFAARSARLRNPRAAAESSRAAKAAGGITHEACGTLTTSGSRTGPGGRRRLAPSNRTVGAYEDTRRSWRLVQYANTAPDRNDERSSLGRPHHVGRVSPLAPARTFGMYIPKELNVTSQCTVRSRPPRPRRALRRAVPGARGEVRRHTVGGRLRESDHGRRPVLSHPEHETSGDAGAAAFLHGPQGLFGSVIPPDTPEGTHDDQVHGEDEVAAR